MNYQLIKDNLDLINEFEENPGLEVYTPDIEGFKKWIIDSNPALQTANDRDWVGKGEGRTADSVINTLLVHMNRYARSYSKSAIYGSPFTTQEDFIYLINLKAFGEMTKMELIKKNIQEKPLGMQIINRLIAQGWVEQTNSETDRRSKVIKITPEGIKVLDSQMIKIRQATNIVTGDLKQEEKLELIRLLEKLNDFHQPIYHQNHSSADLLNEAIKAKNLVEN